jgi:hypothetical protein
VPPRLAIWASRRLDEQTALGEFAELDGRKAELFNESGHLRGRVIIVARRESDSSAALDVRVLRERARRQMVEGLHPSRADQTQAFTTEDGSPPSSSGVTP